MIGTTSGGSLIRRSSPSSHLVSLPSARRLFLRSRVLHGPLDLVGGLPAEPLADAGEDLVGVEARVPEVEIAHLRELAHRLPVRAAHGRHGAAPVAGAEPRVARCHRDAGAEPLQVPLPRPREGLVEVVQVEDELPVRRGEAAEVRQVGVAAELRGEPGARGLGQVRRHDRRAAAEEGERRRGHPRVPNRKQLRHARLALSLQHPDRRPPGPAEPPIPP